MSTAWSVWVGGGEITCDYITDYDMAIHIAEVWRGKGYDDVQIEEVAQ
jgi:hypothetical protein